MNRIIGPVAVALALAGCGGERAPEKADAAAPSRPVAPAPIAASGAGPAARPEIREFRDWRAVCDNGNRCVAWTGSNEGGWLRVGMEAGPEAAPTVTASEGFTNSTNSAGLGLKIDGRDFDLAGGPRDAANAAAARERAGRILNALAAARSVSLRFEDRSITLSPSGVSAALLWIDERQGRLGTTAALLRRGERPAAAVPPPPRLPAVRPAPPVAQTGFAAANPMEDEPDASLRAPAALEARQEVKACRAENNEYLDKAVLAARLDASTVLWGIPCGSGAYNATYVLYLARPDGGDVRPADLPTWKPAGGDDEGDLWLVNPVYDPAARTLTVFPRGRGLGDCGTIQTWAWTAKGFALTEERSMGDCQGMPPDYWPTTWRADVRP
jgi:hypothetical protein